MVVWLIVETSRVILKGNSSARILGLVPIFFLLYPDSADHRIVAEQNYRPCREHETSLQHEAEVLSDGK